MKPKILLQGLDLFPIGIISSKVEIVWLWYCFVGLGFFSPGYCVFKAMTYTTVEIVIVVYVQAILHLFILISEKVMGDE